MKTARLIEWRNNMGLSVTEAARACHVGRSTWFKWERGAPLPAWLGLLLSAVTSGLEPIE